MGAVIAIAFIAAPAYRGEAMARDLEEPASWENNPIVRDALAPHEDFAGAAGGRDARGGLWLRLTDLERSGHSLYW